jgi:phage-related protein
MCSTTMLISKYYRARDGTEPVKAFIDTLQPQAQAAVQRHIRRLNMLGEDLDYPFTSQVDGELRELRAWSGNRHFRIYYRRSGSFAVLLHAIEKRTRALPLADTAVARARYDDFKRRIDAQPRVPPRPLGSDAR